MILNRFFETLETKRLILRKLSPEDFNYLFENLSDFEIMNFLGHRTDEEFQKEKAKYEKGYSSYNRSFQFFQMIEKETQNLIGGCGFHNWFMDHRRAELGYALRDEENKNKGFMSEAVPELLDYGFHRMNLNRIEAMVGKENIPSLKLMARFNFVKEGLLRKHYFVNEHFEDSLVFSILREDYL